MTTPARLREDADFEAKHPRDDDGQFAEKPGGPDDSTLRNALRRRGVRGDALLNAVDLAHDLREHGGEITRDGMAVVYHRTTPEGAAKIVAEGAMFGKEPGLFFGTHPTGQIEGYGDAVVKATIPLERLELNDVFPHEAHVRMPTGTIGQRIPLKVERWGGVREDADFEAKHPRDDDGKFTEKAGGEDWRDEDARVLREHADFLKANPHTWRPKSSIQDRGAAFDALPDDALVWVFHGTPDKATADAFARAGVDPAGKPRALGRERYEAGEEARFAPGAGLGAGLYVGSDPFNVEGYGRYILAIRVKKSQLSVTPEQATLGERSVGTALAHSDAQIEGAIPAADVYVIPGPDTHRLKAYEAIPRLAVRAREAARVSTPPDRFVAALAALRRDIDRLPAPVVRGIRVELERTRRAVLAELLTVEPTSYDALRLRALERRLASILDRFATQYARILDPAARDMAELGADVSARPLIESGLIFHRPEISRRLLEVTSQYRADLIRGLTRDAVARISRDLFAGALRGDPLDVTARRIAGRLTGPSTFGSIATRAETIARTELGRVQAVAAQAALEAAASSVPDLKKQWQHSGTRTKHTREGHVEAGREGRYGGQVRAVTAPFRIRPMVTGPRARFELLLYPRDPAASPENTINCGCLAVPFRTAWADVMKAERQEQAAFLAARARANAFGG